MTNIEKKGYHPVILRIYNKEKQLILEDEVLCAYDSQTNKIQAMGKEAREYIDDNQIVVVNPLKWGAVADFTIFQKLMKLTMKKVMKGMLRKPRLVLCIPAKLTQVETIAFKDALMESQMREVYLFEKTFKEVFQEKNTIEGIQPELYAEFVSDYYACEYYG